MTTCLAARLLYVNADYVTRLGRLAKTIAEDRHALPGGAAHLAFRPVVETLAFGALLREVLRSQF